MRQEQHCHSETHLYGRLGAIELPLPHGVDHVACRRDCCAWLRCWLLICGLEAGPVIEELKTRFALVDKRADRTSKFLPSEHEKLSLLPAVLAIVLLSAALWADIIALIVWII
jgi:hypothetical protein